MKKLVFIIFVLALPNLVFAEPNRSKGISMHMLPERVAKLDGRPWGLWVSYAEYLKPEPGQPVLQSVQDYIAFIEKQSPSVQENGVWIVTTNPNAYSKSEIELLDQIKALSKEKGIILFICRGAELPDGWKRY